MIYLGDFLEYSKLVRRESTNKSYFYIIRRFFRDCPVVVENVSKQMIINYCLGKTECKIDIQIKSLKRALKQYFIYLNQWRGYNLDLSIFEIKVLESEFRRQSVMRFDKYLYLHVRICTNNILLFGDTFELVKKLNSKAHSFAQKRNLMLILMYSLTGMRRSEVINMRLCDVDLRDGFISIWKTKTNQPRNVPIPNFLVTIIKNYLIDRDKLEPDNDYLIVNYLGKQMKTTGIEAVVKSCKTLWGVSFSFHSFRRGYASDLFNSGVEAAYISKSLGHASIATTFRYYVYFNDKDLKTAISKHPAYSL